MSLETSYAIPWAGAYRTSCSLPPATWPIAARVVDGAAGLATPSVHEPPRPARGTGNLRMLVRFAGFELDCIERQLIAPGGGTQRLPGLEFALLQIFLSRPHAPLRRAELAAQLTRDRGTRLSGRTVDSYVSRLRRRLARAGADALIDTVRATGYRFAAHVTRA